MAIRDRPQRRRGRAAAEREGISVTESSGRERLTATWLRCHGRIDAESAARSLYREMARLSAGERAVLELVALDGFRSPRRHAPLGIGPSLLESGCTVLAGCSRTSLAPPHPRHQRSTGGVLMNTDSAGGGFEERLLDELRSLVVARPDSGKERHLEAAGMGCVAVAAPDSRWWEAWPPCSRCAGGGRAVSR